MKWKPRHRIGIPTLDHRRSKQPRPPAREPERPDWAHPALTGLDAWTQMISALEIPYQAQRDAELYIRPRAGRPPASQQTGTRPHSPSQNRARSPCCASASARHSTSSPDSSVPSPASSPRPSASSGHCSPSRPRHRTRRNHPGNGRAGIYQRALGTPRGIPRNQTRRSRYCHHAQPAKPRSTGRIWTAAGRNQRSVDLILAVNRARVSCRLPVLRLVRGSWVGAGSGWAAGAVAMR